MNTVQYKCPSCGAELVFDPAQQNFSCPFCSSTFTEAEMRQRYQQMEQQAERTADPQAETVRENAEDTAFETENRLYTCQNCGAQIIADGETAATFCYYCHAPVVLAGRLSGEYRPAYVLPFALNREKALQTMQAWCKKRWFLPKGFTSESQLQKMTGIYVPFWLTSCRAEAELHALAKRQRSWREGDYRVTQTTEYTVERAATLPYQRIPADGSQKIEDALMDAIEPFPYQNLKPFTMQYLSGFFAQKYDVPYAQVLPRVQQRVEQHSKGVLQQSIQGYSSYVVTSHNARLENVQHQYVLMPVWFLNYQYHGKDYSYAMNGQTGKQAGTAPLSWGKALLFSGILALAVMVLVVLLGGYLFR